MSVPDNMSNLAVSTITKTLTKQIIIKLMKITQFRKNEDTIALSVMDLDILVNKIKTEIKSRPVSTFREHLRYTLSDERCMFAACKNIAEQFFTIHRISRDSFFHFNANLIPPTFLSNGRMIFIGKKKKYVGC